ncbi:MAG: SRPBCC domain-containing protein [Cyclobacteriaceae bacterium]
MKKVSWKIHTKTNPEGIFKLLTTDEGRCKYWAETSVEIDGEIDFSFYGGLKTSCRVLDTTPFSRFAIKYFNTLVTIFLEESPEGGTELTLICEDIPEENYSEMYADWVSVLLALKAYADFKVDIRNHHPNKTWKQGYCDV